MNERYEKDLEAQNEKLMMRLADAEYEIEQFDKMWNERKDFHFHILEQSWNLIQSIVTKLHAYKTILEDQGIDDSDIDDSLWNIADKEAIKYLERFLKKTVNYQEYQQTKDNHRVSFIAIRKFLDIIEEECSIDITD